MVLIDVDGPLNPYMAKATKRPEGYETYRMHPSGWEGGKGLRVWLKPSHGASLLDTGAELVWASMWGSEANDWIGPEIGLPVLKAVRFGLTETVLGTGNRDLWDRLYHKTPRIAYTMRKYYGGVPFLWIDDETTEADEQFLREMCGVEVKVLTIDPAIGLVDEDFELIKEWVAKNGTVQ